MYHLLTAPAAGSEIILSYNKLHYDTLCPVPMFSLKYPNWEVLQSYLYLFRIMFKCIWKMLKKVWIITFFSNHHHNKKEPRITKSLFPYFYMKVQYVFTLKIQSQYIFISLSQRQIVSKWSIRKKYLQRC